MTKYIIVHTNSLWGSLTKYPNQKELETAFSYARPTKIQVIRENRKWLYCPSVLLKIVKEGTSYSIPYVAQIPSMQLSKRKIANKLLASG